MSKSEAKKSKSSKSPTATAQSASSKTYSYKARGPPPLKPAVELVLHAQDGKILPAVRALVDSGADQSLFPVSYMTPLGIDIKDCQEINGEALEPGPNTPPETSPPCRAATPT